ncbi:hypothetical protein CBER1_05155 [Cercospora berteroae]|uniref:Uncharacterized protein n=1 Tax=Cercospora berteroae TaxID=357750 RepID=A0A2S6C3A3_9PEZI|nr:hypothetical protein CBER1_05155 [Cercospora berteroae]
MPTYKILPIKADMEYRRQRVGAPKAFFKDFIREMIIATLDDFNLHNLQDPDRFIAIAPAKGSTPIYDLCRRPLGFDRYSFEDWRWEPKVMNVELDSACEVWVHARYGWTSLVEWLKGGHHPDDEDDSDLDADLGPWPWTAKESRERQQVLWDKQWRLWTFNGKKFQFRDVPAEIRNSIYDFALGPEQDQSPYRYARIGRYGTRHMERGALPLPSMNILYLSRQVYVEACHILFERTVFRLTSSKDFNRLSDSKTLVSRIRRLELALPHEDLLECSKRVADLRRHGLEEINVFQRMQLKDLVIDLAQPKALIDIVLMTHNNAGSTMVPEFACQKLTVDKILRKTFPWIAEQPVRLIGALKNQQKKDFEAKCAAKRKDYLDWCRAMSMDGHVPALVEYEEWKAEEVGGVWLDGRGAVVAESVEEALDGVQEDVVSEAEDEMALEQCRCEVVCTPARWTNED